MGETTRGAKRLGGKRPGRKRLGGETTRGGNGLGAKRLGFMQIPYRLTSLSIDRRLVIGVSTKLTLSSKPVNSESFTIKSHDCPTLQFKSPMTYTSAFREKELMSFSKT